MKPIEFTKVTKKYILGKIEEYKGIITPGSRKILYDKTLEELKKRRVLLKDMKAISYWIGKGFIEIAFYTKDAYFTKYLETYM